MCHYATPVLNKQRRRSFIFICIRLTQTPSPVHTSHQMELQHSLDQLPSQTHSIINALNQMDQLSFPQVYKDPSELQSSHPAQLQPAADNSGCSQMVMENMEYYQKGDLVFALNKKGLIWPGFVLEVCDSYSSYKVCFFKHDFTRKYSVGQLQDYNQTSKQKYQPLYDKDLTPTMRKRVNMALEQADHYLRKKRQNEANQHTQEMKKINEKFFNMLFKEKYQEFKREILQDKQKSRKPALRNKLTVTQKKTVCEKAKQKALRIFYEKNKESMMQAQREIIMQAQKEVILPVHKPKDNNWSIESNKSVQQEQIKQNKLASSVDKHTDRHSQRQQPSIQYVQVQSTPKEQAEPEAHKPPVHVSKKKGEHVSKQSKQKPQEIEHEVQENQKIHGLVKKVSESKMNDEIERELLTHLSDHLATQDYLKHQLKLKRDKICYDFQLTNYQHDSKFRGHRWELHLQSISKLSQPHLVVLCERILNRFFLWSIQYKLPAVSTCRLANDFTTISTILEEDLIDLQHFSSGNIAGKVAYFVHCYQEYSKLYNHKRFLMREYLYLKRWLECWQKQYEHKSEIAKINHENRRKTIAALNKFPSKE